MMIKNLYFLLSCFCCLFMNCQNDPIPKQEKTEIVGIETPQPEPQPQPEPNPDMPQNPSNIKILALGDSYTIGESVCETCRFPEQLKKGMSEKLKNALVTLNIVARTGWTTSSLKNVISNANLPTDHDLVTLLIGVNNQYQNQPFEMFQNEFPELANAAIQYAKGEKKNVIVISIPDYAYTPFGKGNKAISEAIDRYNNFIESYCSQKGITYIYITDITRKGLLEPNLVASDGLHPSEVAYSRFVERLLPVALGKL